MCLCSNYGGIENIFHWYPQNDQWWITGFNPKHVGKIDVHKQVMVGSIDFSGFEELYWAFEENITAKYQNLLKFLVFDEQRHNVWICWY